MSEPEPFNESAFSVKALKNIEKLAWPNGARLTCPVCLISKVKTPEEMAQHLKRWPRHCDVPVDVKPL